MSSLRCLGSLLVLCGAIPIAAQALPINPNPLWSLTSDATLIVVAKVELVEPLRGGEDSWDSAVAHLRVIETLKGTPRVDVRVPYAANLLCPAPARYLAGETVVAFLMREGRRWRTVSLSYGTLYPRGEDLDDVTAMIRAALVVHNCTACSKRLELHRHEWLVKAAALPGTRWHGLQELVWTADRVRADDEGGAEPPWPALTDRHLRLLADALVAAPKLDHTLPMMLRVLRGHRDARVGQLAISTLSGLLLLDQPPRWTRDLLWQVLEQHGDVDPRTRLAELGVGHWQVTPGQLRRIWSEAQAELGIADLPPAEIDLEPYLPVGGQTPG